LHTPSVLPSPFRQWVLPSPGRPLPSTPQQSRSSWQTLPSGRQPVAGWHTKTPVDAWGAQSLLQQEPQPAKPWHTSPSVNLLAQLVPLAHTGAQVPRLAPSARVHRPEQQDSPRVQTSPVWMHQDGARSHVPSLQYLEQHWLSPVQLLPDVLQVSFSGSQVSFEHVPLQHSPSLEQLSLSSTH
jgi:hypothetical protein